MDKKYFHEDDYRQIELLPFENYEYCQKELGIISDFSEKHLDVNGYTDMYIRGENQKPTATLNISIQDFSSFLLSFGFNQYTEVETGYSSYREPAPNTWAFDKSNITVFANFKNHIIQNIWLDFYPNQQSRSDSQIHEFFQSIGTKWDLILADWALHKVINLKDSKSIESYWEDEEDEIITGNKELPSNYSKQEPESFLKRLITIITFWRRK